MSHESIEDIYKSMMDTEHIRRMRMLIELTGGKEAVKKGDEGMLAVLKAAAWGHAALHEIKKLGVAMILHSTKDDEDGCERCETRTAEMKAEGYTPDDSMLKVAVSTFVVADEPGTPPKRLEAERQYVFRLLVLYRDCYDELVEFGELHRAAQKRYDDAEGTDTILGVMFGL